MRTRLIFCFFVLLSVGFLPPVYAVEGDELRIATGETQTPAQIAALSADLEEQAEHAAATPEQKRSLRDWLAAHKYRLGFATARFVMGQQTMMWTLMLDPQHPAPTAAAIAVSVFTGGVASGFMFFNPSWQKVSMWPSVLRRLAGVPSETRLGTAMDWTARILRWGAVEIAIVTAAKLLMYTLDLTPDVTAVGMALNILATTALNTIGAAPWGLAISALKNAAIDSGDGTPEHAYRMQFRSDVAVLGLSVIGTALTAAQLRHVPYAHEAMVGVALLGTGVFGAVHAIIRRYFPKRPLPSGAGCAERLEDQAS